MQTGIVVVFSLVLFAVLSVRAAEQTPAAKPAAEPAPKPAAEPAAKPAAAPAPKPAAEPAAKPAAAPAAKPAAEPAPKPAAEPAPKPAPKPAAEAATKPAAEPATKPATKPAAKPATKPAAKPAAKQTPTEKKWQLKDPKPVTNSDFMAQSFCTSRTNSGFVLAVRRPCDFKSEKNIKCSEVCASNQLRDQDARLKKKTGRCTGAIHIYTNKLQRGDLSIGLKSYVYGRGCGAAYCGPNYCCCRF